MRVRLSHPRLRVLSLGILSSLAKAKDKHALPISLNRLRCASRCSRVVAHRTPPIILSN